MMVVLNPGRNKRILIKAIAAVARLPVSVLLPRFQLVLTDSSCHMMAINCQWIWLNSVWAGLRIGRNWVCEAPVMCDFQIVIVLMQEKTFHRYGESGFYVRLPSFSQQTGDKDVAWPIHFLNIYIFIIPQKSRIILEQIVPFKPWFNYFSPCQCRVFFCLAAGQYNCWTMLFRQNVFSKWHYGSDGGWGHSS